MGISLSVTEMARNFSEYINRVTYRRESFTLTKGGRAVAEVRPIPRGVKVSDLPAIFASLPHLGDDAEQFGKDIDEARRQLASWPVDDPWDS